MRIDPNIFLEQSEAHEMAAVLLRWQQAAWAGDAYKYCDASNERDRILDELLGEGNAPSKSDNALNGATTTTIGDN